MFVFVCWKITWLLEKPSFWAHKLLSICLSRSTFLNNLTQVWFKYKLRNKPFIRRWWLNSFGLYSQFWINLLDMYPSRLINYLLTAFFVISAIHFSSRLDNKREKNRVGHINICQKWQFFGPKMGQPGSVFHSECPKYYYCSSHLVLSILRNEK